jgi:tRNA A37 threonylcarbamoyladenosine dehydratase
MESEENLYTRTRWILGSDAVEKLRTSHAAVFGLGGVGSAAAEALARSGVGQLTLVDYDVISVTNLNRQIHALTSTIGKYKTDVMRERLLDINPDAIIHARTLRFTREYDIDDWPFDYIIDAVDDLPAKIQIILSAGKHGIPVVSSMGAGNKLDPTCFRVADIYETHTCPLAKAMRKLCREAGITSLKTIFSSEKPITVREAAGGAIGSVSFVPAASGLAAAAEAVKDLTNGRL